MKHQQRFYVDLDCLHDTRYGLILHKWPWLISKLDLSEYKHRVTDNFIIKLGIGIEGWETAWGERDRKVLMQTPPTVFCYQLVNELHEKFMSVKLGTPLELPRLVINTYPYKLSKKELEDYDLVARSFYGSVVESLEVVYIPKEAMTFKYLTDNFESVTMYSWREWLGDVVEEMKKAPSPSFVLNGPALLDLKSSISVADDIVNDGINPFLEVKDFLKECLTLNLFDVSLFNLRPPGEKT